MAEGKSVAYASEAGTPLVADPGFALGRAAIEAGHTVLSAPGPSAVLAALTVSGLPSDRFLFAGFPPSSGAARQTFLKDLNRSDATVILYESPKRIQRLLDDLGQCVETDRRIVICRELTKRFEQTKRGTLAELHEWAAEGTKGELVLVVAGGTSDTADLAQVASLAVEKISAGEPTSAVVQELAKIYNVSKNELYDLVLQLKPKQTKSGKPAD